MKILLSTFRTLPVTKPAADAIRFQKLANFISESHQASYLCSNESFHFRVSSYNERPCYQLPSLGHGMLSVGLLTLLVPWYVKKIIKAQKPDAIFINSVFLSLAANTAKRHGLKIHVDIMGLDHLEIRVGKASLLQKISRPLIRKLEFNLIQKADIITCVNEAHASIVRNYAACPVFVLRDGVDTPPATSQADRKSSSTDQRIVLFVGSLTHRRLDSLFEAMSSVISNNPDTIFQIIGDGTDTNHYIEMAHALNLSDHVQFLGYISHDHIPEFIQNSDICYSDDWSTIGFPTKVFEYMSLGKPVIVENTEAVREIVINKSNGVLYSGPAELDTQLQLMLRNPILCKYIGETARQDIINSHTWQHRNEELSRIYDTFNSL